MILTGKLLVIVVVIVVVIVIIIVISNINSNSNISIDAVMGFVTGGFSRSQVHHRCSDQQQQSLVCSASLEYPTGT